MKKSKFPIIKQLDSQDCGFACIRMISKFYGVDIETDNVVFLNANLQKRGLSLYDLGTICEEIGFDKLFLKTDFQKIKDHIPLPAIFFWNQNHYVVVYRIKHNRIFVADPGYGRVTYTMDEFIKGWYQDEEQGVVLLLEPTEKLFSKKTEIAKKISVKHLFHFFAKHRTFFFLISITLLLSSVIELIFPFFTQRIIDKGVLFKDVSLIYVILISQLVLFVSKVSLEFYRSWVFIHISSRISLSIISNFLIKLMKLPIKFFNSKNIGDLVQRIHDHKRIEDFLSKDLIQTVFSIFTLVIYLSILLYLNFNVFWIVAICSSLELIWIFSFLKKIKELDHKTFSLEANDQNKIYELINSMQEIKLNNIEDYKKDEWQEIQIKMYKNNINKLKINQQYESYKFITFIQTLLVVFACSMAIINNSMTVGTMLAVMFIIGGINVPVSNMINFVLKYQLVSLSFERLNQIHGKEDEEDGNTITNLVDIADIQLNNLHFSFDNSQYILKNLTFNIPAGKTTAIVGVSGSGKTTLLKLLLKFYKPNIGEITLDGQSIDGVKNFEWRKKCGVVLQDSVIFSDSVSYNIALTPNPDIDRVKEAIELVNLRSFIEGLPLKYNTLIGSEGIGISQGQRQRILIARAIYKNPDYLFFDEATNSLDANNERLIVENIEKVFRNKTRIIVAHRLSTVKDADQIIVLDNGTIIESGTHDHLIKNRGKYYELVKNQLELGL